MTFLLDAGAFIALERRGRVLGGALRGEGRVTHGGVVAQVWRGGPQAARMARGLRGVEVVPLDEGLGKVTGMLLRDAGTSDVIDAALVALARDGDTILTSDPHDIAHLAEVAGVWVEVLRV